MVAGLLPPELAALSRRALEVVEATHPDLEEGWGELAAELAEGAGDRGRAGKLLLEQTDRHYTFRIDDGPLPIDDLVATIRVRDEGEDACSVEWEATFEPVGVPDHEAVELNRGFFQAGLDAL